MRAGPRQRSRWSTELTGLGAGRKTLDRDFLQSFGRFVERDAAHELLVEHDAIKEQLASPRRSSRASPSARCSWSASRRGSSSFLMLLAARAAAQAGPSSRPARRQPDGRADLGQLEERLRRLPTELAAEKRVLWYVPDFLQLAPAVRTRPDAQPRSGAPGDRRGRIGDGR